MCCSQGQWLTSLHHIVSQPSSTSWWHLQEQELSPEKRVVANVGKMDAKKHLEAEVQKMMSGNIVQCMGTMLDTIVF